MNNSDSDIWWSSLTSDEKLHIVNKLGFSESNPNNASSIFLGLPDEKKIYIKEHCVNDHGFIRPAWNEGFSMSY